MSSLIIDRDYLRSIIKDVVRKRRDQKDKKDQIFLDSLMDADFIDEEEVRKLFLKCWNIVPGFL